MIQNIMIFDKEKTLYITIYFIVIILVQFKIVMMMDNLHHHYYYHNKNSSCFLKGLAVVYSVYEYVDQIL